MNKIVLCAASYYNQKYFFNNDLSPLPESIQKDIKTISICMAQKIQGIFTIGFYEDGNIFLESQGNENDFDYDEIGARIETDKLKENEKELFKALQNWYNIVILPKKIISSQF